MWWVSSFFLLITEQYLIICIYHKLFIHSSIDEHLDYFQFGTVMNIHVKVIVWTLFLKENYLQLKLLSQCNCAFNFIRN